VARSGDRATTGNGEAAPAEYCDLHFAIRDTGIGIPPEKQQSIFAAFTQADSSTTRRYGGTGLGLTISARLVELMGGRIGVESEVGQGSTFHFTARFGVHHGPPAGRDPEDQARLRGLRVLVVDDNATNRTILERTLDHWGMVPVLADGGAAALGAVEQAGRRGEPFTMILLDAHMPLMDGFCLAERLLGRSDLAGAKLMMLTSGGQPGDAIRCRALGLTGYLTKPVKQADLWRALLRALDAPVVSEPSRRASAVQPVARRLRILVAEDNPMNQALATRLLAKQGHAVIVACNGREAVAAVERGSFDLVLMDVQMPEMDGLDAAAVIRKAEECTGGHVPIIAMTAYAMTGDRERCLAAGMDAYVAKPIRAEELFAVIGQLTVAPAALPAEANGACQEPVLNRAEALDRVGGDEDLFRELAAVFLDQSPRWLSAIRQALDGQDAAQLRAAAHPLKGSLGTFAAQTAVAAALRLETMGRKGDLTGGREALADLEREMARLEPELTEIARGHRPDGQPAGLQT
jgi:CheY-like chemotaxis protein